MEKDAGGAGAVRQMCPALSDAAAEAIEKYLTGRDLHQGPSNLDEVASNAPDLTDEGRAQITMMARVMENRFLNGS